MADSAEIKYSGSVIVTETLEALDTTSTTTLIHSKVDKGLGGSFNFNPASVSEFSLVTGLETTDALVDITFSDGTTGHSKETRFINMLEPTDRG